MIVQQLDGKFCIWKLTRRINTNASKLHENARILLQQLFPAESFYEEVYIPGQTKLYLDFFIPTFKQAIEVQGQQHFKCSPFFHKEGRLDYLKASHRDIQKRRWCELNKIKLIELRFDEDIEKWKNKILS